MNTLPSTNTSAVIHTRLHRTSVPLNHLPERTGAPNRASALNAGPAGTTGARGCARGAGRVRPSYLGAVENLREAGEPGAEAASGEARQGKPEAAEVPAQREESASEAEFTAYVRERRASLYATAYHLTGDRFEAEDLLQSALFSTYRAWHRISDKAAVGGYLRRTMTNLHISAWRRRKLNEYPTEELPETVGEQDAMRGTELRTVLWQALARLPELQRTMLVLRYYEGRTDPEIAEILDISVGTVKSSIWRSLRRLRDDEVLSFGRDQEESFDELVA